MFRPVSQFLLYAIDTAAVDTANVLAIAGMNVLGGNARPEQPLWDADTESNYPFWGSLWAKMLNKE